MELSDHPNATVFNSSLPVAILICSWINLTLLIIPAIVVNSITLVNLLVHYKLSKSIRICLSNVLVSCLTLACSGVMKYSSALVIGYSDLSSSGVFCRFYAWISTIGQVSRLSFMPMLAIVVYILIRYGEPTRTGKGRRILFIATGTLWIFLVLLTTLSFSPEVIKSPLTQDILCTIVISRTPLGYVSAGVYLSVFGIFSYILTVVVGVTGVCFVKHSTIRDTRALKATAKFTFFLLIGNTVGLLGQLVPLLFGAIDLKEDVEKAIIIQYVASGFIFMSLYPTPILILVYFRAFGNGRIGKIMLRCKRLCIYQQRESSDTL